MANNQGSRDLSKDALWRGRLGEQRRSGESIRGFCRRRGFSEALFHYWKRRLSVVDEAGFVEARVVVEAEPQEVGRLVLWLPAGYEVAIEPGFDAPTLRRLIAALADHPC